MLLLFNGSMYFVCAQVEEAHVSVPLSTLVGDVSARECEAFVEGGVSVVSGLEDVGSVVTVSSLLCYVK